MIGMNVLLGFGLGVAETLLAIEFLRRRREEVEEIVGSLRDEFWIAG